MATFSAKFFLNIIYFIREFSVRARKLQSNYLVQSSHQVNNEITSPFLTLNWTMWLFFWTQPKSSTLFIASLEILKRKKGFILNNIDKNHPCFNHELTWNPISTGQNLQHKTNHASFLFFFAYDKIKQAVTCRLN